MKYDFAAEGINRFDIDLGNVDSSYVGTYSMSRVFYGTGETFTLNLCEIEEITTMIRDD